MAVGVDEGLAEDSVITCHNVIAIPKPTFDPAPVGRIGVTKRAALDRALRYALDIQY